MLADGGLVCIQLLQALNATISPLDRGGARNHPDQGGVHAGRPRSMVLYRITLFPIAEKFCVAAPELLVPLYADNADFDGHSIRLQV